MLRPTLTKSLESRPGFRLPAIQSLPITSKIALGVIALVAAMAVFAPLLGVDPLASGTPVLPPGPGHPFGTDAIGRDILARVAFGARSSLVLGLVATGVALAAAAVLGSIAATAGKATSEVLMRILDIVMSFPGIALAAVFVAVFGNALPVLIFAIAFLYTPQLTRVVRANVLAQFGEDYVSASRVMGARPAHILIKHVARNCLAPIMVFATVLVADAIVFEASLSFINAGVKPPRSDRCAGQPGRQAPRRRRGRREGPAAGHRRCSGRCSGPRPGRRRGGQATADNESGHLARAGAQAHRPTGVCRRLGAVARGA